MPKLITLAARRMSARDRPGMTPNTSAAVRAWMSWPRVKASSSAGSPDRWASDAQLDLRVVGGDQHRPAAAAMNAARMRRPSSPRIGMFCRFGSLELRRPVAAPVWLKLGVQPAGRGIDGRGQRVDVRRLQLRQRAVLEDLCRQRMLRRQAREHVDVGRESGLAAAYAARRQPEALEQHGRAAAAAS